MYSQSVNFLRLSYLVSRVFVFLLLSSSAALAVVESGKKIVEPITYGHVANWVLGLIVVLSLFFTCIWFMKKMGVMSVNAKDNMKIVAGLSLGGREKILLVQVGKKQLVLGVAPGTVNNLLVLEGEDCVFQERLDTNTQQAENDFSQKLKQMMKGSLNE